MLTERKEPVSAVKRKLTPKTLLFIEAFNPEADDWQVEAIRAGKQVGYAPNYVRKMVMNNANVIRELKHREEYGMSQVERDRKLRKDFWRDTMEGIGVTGKDGIEMKDRLRASELWGKSEGDFIHRIEADVNVAKGLEEKLTKALEEDDGSD